MSWLLITVQYGALEEHWRKQRFFRFMADGNPGLVSFLGDEFVKWRTGLMMKTEIPIFASVGERKV